VRENSRKTINSSTKRRFKEIVLLPEKHGAQKTNQLCNKIILLFKPQNDIPAAYYLK
jgi:hypothetical protein